MNITEAKDYYSYDAFLALVDELVAEGKTSGPEQTELRIGFTKLNQQRMQRINKTFTVSDDAAAKLKEATPQIWWVITEAWCGDSAQNLPVIAKLAEASDGRIELRILLRDEHLDIMDQYLTNGGRSIPKLIAMEREKELFQWGPRPVPAQQILLDWKAFPNGRTHDDFEVELHTWYARNKGQSTQRELAELTQ